MKGKKGTTRKVISLARCVIHTGGPGLASRAIIMYTYFVMYRILHFVLICVDALHDSVLIGHR